MFTLAQRNLLSLVLMLLLLAASARMSIAEPALLLQLHTGTPESKTAWQAYEQLRWGKDPAMIEMLLGGLRDQDARIRLQCVKILCARQEPQAVEPIIHLLQTQGPQEQCAILEELASFHAPRFLDELLLLAKASDAGLRDSAVQGLFTYNDPRISEVALYLVKNKGITDNPALAHMLAQGDDPAIIAPLIVCYGKFFADPAIQDRLLRFGSQAVEPLLAALQAPGVTASAQCSIFRTLSGIKDPRALAMIIHYVRDKNRRVRDAAITALCCLGSDGLDAVQSLAHDGDDQVRASALLSLDNAGYPRAIDLLLAAMSDHQAEIRLAALAELLNKHRDDPRVSEASFTALRDSDAQVRMQALDGVMQSADPRTGETLLRMLADPETEVCAKAADYLGKVRDPRVIDLLLQAARRPHCPDEVPLALVAQHEPRVIPLLMRKLRSTETQQPRRHSLNAAINEELNGDDAPDNINAAGAMANLGIENALARLGVTAYEPLLAALRDSSANVRAGAAETLGILGDPRAYAPLHSALHDAEPRVRLAVVNALGTFQDERTLPWLLTALQDKDAAVRQAALQALQSLHDPRMIAPLLRLAAGKTSDMQADAFDALAGSDDPRVVNFLWKTMHGSDAGLRVKAIFALAADADPRAIPALLALLGDKDPDNRNNAIEQLYMLHDPHTIPQLIALLSDKDHEVREDAANTLLNFDDTRAFHALITAMLPAADGLHESKLTEDDLPEFMLLKKVHADRLPWLQAQITTTWNPAVRQRLITLMGGAGAPALAPLLDYLQNIDPEIRAAAVCGLGHTHAAGAVAPLLALLQQEVQANNKGEALTAAIIQALQELHDARAVTPLLDLLQQRDNDDQLNAHIISTLQVLHDARAVMPFLAVAQTGTHDTARRAVQALAYFKDPRVVQPLLAMLASPEPNPVKYIIPEVLGNIGDPRAEPALLNLLATGPKNSDAIIIALGKISDRRAADTLLALLRAKLGQPGDVPQNILPAKLVQTERYGCSNVVSCWTLITAMGMLHEKRAVPLLSAALPELDPGMVSIAAQALGNIGDHSAADALFAQLRRYPLNATPVFPTDTDITPVIAVATALARLKDDHVRALLREAVADDNWRVRQGAALAMGQMGEAWAVEPLLKLLHDSSGRVRAAAVTALGALHDPRTNAPLRALLHDPYPEIREAVRKLLEKAQPH